MSNQPPQDSLAKKKAEERAAELAKDCARGVHTPECTHGAQDHVGEPSGQSKVTEPSDSGKSHETEPGDRGQSHAGEPKWQPDPKKGDKR